MAFVSVVLPLRVGESEHARARAFSMFGGEAAISNT